MAVSETNTDRKPPIGRGAKVRTAVLAATLDELVDRGYAAVTIDNIAKRCGVHKTTVYRRWKDRDTLIADAVAEVASSEIPIIDTHNIDADLQTFARSLVDWLTGPLGLALQALLTPDTARIPQLAAAKRRFFQTRFQHIQPLIQAATLRGQLPPGTDTGELIKALIAPIYLRLLVTAEPVDHEVADASARTALTAARARLCTRPTSGTAPPPGKPIESSSPSHH